MKTALWNLSEAFTNSDLLEVMEKQKRSAQHTQLDIFDIDKTLIMPGARQELYPSRLLLKMKRANRPLVLVTGNDFRTLRPRLERRWDVPAAHVIAGAVGTEIMVRHSQKPDTNWPMVEVDTPDGHFYYVFDQLWDNSIKATKGWNREQVVRTWHYLIASCEMYDESQKLEDQYRLAFQQPELEAKFLETGELPEEIASQAYKVSSHFYANSPAMVGHLIERAFHLLGTELIVCGEIGYNDQHKGEAVQKYCVDSVPITKAGACEYLKNRAGAERLWVAGDSGNDTGMLLGPTDLSIVVGGARWELKQDVHNFINTHTLLAVTGDYHTVNVGGRTLTFYIESGKRIGPQSIEHVFDTYEQTISVPS